jgi:hypothetical protein
VVNETVASLDDMVLTLKREGLVLPNADLSAVPPIKAYLRAWQSTRLAGTYSDLLADRQYGPACRFFLTDLYSPQEFSKRDADIRKAFDLLRKTLPEMMVRGLLKAIELQELSAALDDQLVEVMSNRMGITDSFTRTQYEKAYRACDNYADRVHQIDLIVEAGRILQSAHRIPFTGSTLRLSRLPVRLLGWGELHEFLQRGYDASAPLRNYDVFLDTVKTREREILDRIYRSKPDRAKA